MTRPSTKVVAAEAVRNGHRPPPPTRSVNVGRAALAVLLIVGLSLAFVQLYSSAGDRRTVLAVARAVAAGDVIGPADVAEVRVSADPGLRPVPAERRAEVLGRAAAVELLPGTLLTAAHVSERPPVAVGLSVVGLSLKPGQFPPGVRPGDRVLLVRSNAPAAGSSGGGGLLVQVRGEVLAVDTGAGQGAGTAVVSVAVDGSDAPALAVAGAAGQVSMVVEGRAG